jgi:hypothetical protein
MAPSQRQKSPNPRSPDFITSNYFRVIRSADRRWGLQKRSRGLRKWSVELEKRDLGFRRVERPGLEVIGFAPHSIPRDSAAPCPSFASFQTLGWSNILTRPRPFDLSPAHMISGDRSNSRSLERRDRSKFNGSNRNLEKRVPGTGRNVAASNRDSDDGPRPQCRALWAITQHDRYRTREALRCLAPLEAFRIPSDCSRRCSKKPVAI